ncbi:hypothetical protein ElyMa_003767300 [Elysia marginata]|uniref:Uncharacterized protein n=1 Tax=Elysia marginata TaxID=1093978 RepID=A0AAV4FAJ9_9GAST|nr:hypothetical protein ElyMa_003767300 [Elysia marginata]
MWCYRRVENILEGAQGQQRGTTNGGFNRKTARSAEELALRWSCYKGLLVTSFAAKLWRAELRADEIEDALRSWTDDIKQWTQYRKFGDINRKKFRSTVTSN